jgi:hypothetical protein
MARILTPTELAGLGAAHARTHVRLEIQDDAAAWVDFTEGLHSFNIGSHVDMAGISGSVQLARMPFSGPSLSPLVSDGIVVARGLRIYVTTLEPGFTPAAQDLRLIIDAQIDSVDAGDELINIVVRDRIGAVIADTFMPDTATVPPQAGGWQYEQILDRIIDRTNQVFEFPTVLGPGSGPLVFNRDFEPTGITIQNSGLTTGQGLLVIDRQYVLDALRQAASRIGWQVRPRWDSNNNEFRLAFYEPPWNKTTPDYTIPADRYLLIPRLEQDRDPIRNVVRIRFLNLTTGTHGTRDSILRKDDASRAKYGLRYMEIVEPDDSPINTPALAEMLADNILADLAEPSVVADCEVLMMWPVDMDDIVELGANAEQFTTPQTLAVVGYRHEYGPELERTTLQLRGKPTGGVEKWLGWGVPRQPVEEPGVEIESWSWQKYADVTEPLLELKGRVTPSVASLRLVFSPVSDTGAGGLVNLATLRDITIDTATPGVLGPDGAFLWRYIDTTPTTGGIPGYTNAREWHRDYYVRLEVTAHAEPGATDAAASRTVTFATPLNTTPVGARVQKGGIIVDASRLVLGTNLDVTVVNGEAEISATSSGGSGGGTPDPHATTHHSGGSDALTLGNIGGTLSNAQVTASNVTQHQQALALSADQLVTGTLPHARVSITNVTQHQGSLILSATQVQSGTFGDGRITQSSVTQHQAAIEINAWQVIGGTFDNGRIASSNVTQHQGAIAIDAGQVTSGTFGNFRIAQSNVTQHQGALILSAGQVTVGVFDDLRIPSLAASKITSGTFANARIAQGNVTQHQGALSISPGQVTSGTFTGTYTFSQPGTLQGNWNLGGSPFATNFIAKERVSAQDGTKGKAELYTGETDQAGYLNIVGPNNTHIGGMGWDPAQLLIWTNSNGLRIDGKVQVEGTLRLANLTTTQRDALPSPVDGDMILNTTTNKVQARVNGAWVDLH